MALDLLPDFWPIGLYVLILILSVLFISYVPQTKVVGYLVNFLGSR